MKNKNELIKLINDTKDYIIGNEKYTLSEISKKLEDFKIELQNNNKINLEKLSLQVTFISMFLAGFMSSICIILISILIISISYLK